MPATPPDVDSIRRRRLGFTARTLLVLALVLAALETLHRLASDDRIPRLSEAEAEAALVSADRPAVLFFSVTGCHFCSGSLKLLHHVAKETGDEIRVLEVDLEDARVLGPATTSRACRRSSCSTPTTASEVRASAVTTRTELESLLGQIRPPGS